MKHKGYIEIEKPREEVVKYFVDPKYRKEYQDGFVKTELIKGKPEDLNTISKLYYKYGKREMVLTETVTKNNLPEEFEAFYHHKHMDNTMKCSFIEITPTKTRYNYEFAYTRINWVIPKLMAILFPSMYRKPAEKWMKQFKEFVEKQ